MSLNLSWFANVRHSEILTESNYLGLDIQYDRAEGVLRIDQQKYLMKILARFGMLDCTTRKTPMAGDYRKRLRKRDDLEKYPVCRKRQRLYRQLVGSIMFLAVSSRPDIAFATKELSRHLNNPGEVHVQAALRVLRYLKGTASYALAGLRNRPYPGKWSRTMPPHSLNPGTSVMSCWWSIERI